jgi:CubicO group peptidase (beta-lactamase class C family)
MNRVRKLMAHGSPLDNRTVSKRITVLLLMTAATWFCLAGSFVLAQSASSSDLVPLEGQPPHTPWPTERWPRGGLPPLISRHELNGLLDVVKHVDPQMKETRAVVIVWRGRLVAERYASGYGPGTRLISWSMAKSITQALVGIAVRKDLVKVDAPMGYPSWAATGLQSRVTWRQWLNMVDGQDYHELGVTNLALDDSAKMLFGVGRFNVAAYAAHLPIIGRPGEVWNYNSAGYDLTAGSLGQLLVPRNSSPEIRRAAMLRFMQQNLFGPIGMHSAQPEFDRSGTFIGASLLYATATDFARFGYLYLRDGIWNGQRILPEGWVDFARTRTPGRNCDVYGAGWWIAPSQGPGKPYPSAFSSGPKDEFYARGHEGQLIAVVPSKDLVLVRLGLTPNDNGPGWPAIDRWAAHIANLFPQR